MGYTLSVILNLSINLLLRRDLPNSDTIPINCNSFKDLKKRALKKGRECENNLYFPFSYVINNFSF